MDRNLLFHERDRAAWEHFVSTEHLTEQQAQSFEHYMDLLLTWNQKFNLTAITQIPLLLSDHFQDSLAVLKVMNFPQNALLCDVGSGGGFPGIPLKIMRPDLPMILIEVNQKKQLFLKTVITELGLATIEVCPLDWRTFLRKTSYPVTHCLARASLKPAELLRLFHPDSHYTKATIIYWASQQWQPTHEEERFMSNTAHYDVGKKHRSLIFFAAQQ